MQMNNNSNKIDRIFFGIVLSLIIIGVIMFISASLGILNKNEAKFYSVISQKTSALTASLLRTCFLFFQSGCKDNQLYLPTKFNCK